MWQENFTAMLTSVQPDGWQPIHWVCFYILTLYVFGYLWL